MYDRVKKVVLDSGLWNGAQMQTHGFVLSPDVYTITEDQRIEPEELGRALHECLAGLGRIAAIACTPSLGHGVIWKELGAVLRTGIPLHYHDIQIHKPGQVPTVFKVDLMRTIDGRYVIAEIDGYNKRGLGYSVLCARMGNALSAGARTFCGVAKVIADETCRRGYEKLVLLYAEQERFYLPDFRIFQDALEHLGIHVAVRSETDMDATALNQNALRHAFFVDFPFCYHNMALNELLPRLYMEEKIDFLYPPKPFLSSKALLAIMRNDSHDSELEAILHAFISAKALACVRRYIPETYLVSKRKKNCLAYYQDVCREKPFVLKEVISSGLHGTIFMDDESGRFEKTLMDACASYHKFILQEEVTNAPHPFLFYTNEGAVEKAMWFLRMIVLYASHFIADIDVTARQDKRVHGAKDCLQLGTVIL